jgi:hypothetical protein
MNQLFRFCGLLAATLCFANCANEQDLANQRVLERGFFSLLGNSPIDSALTQVEIFTGTRRYVYSSQTDSTMTMSDLKTLLRKGRLSPSDPRGRKYGATRSKIGTVSVFSKDARRSYDLCGTADPNLFCVLVDHDGDIGHSLLYFYFEDGHNPFQQGTRSLTENR